MLGFTASVSPELSRRSTWSARISFRFLPSTNANRSGMPAPYTPAAA